MISQRKQYQKGGLGRWYWNLRDRKVISCIEEERKIVDIGCGEGITLEKLIKKFPDREIKGVDNSRKNIEICQKLKLPVLFGDIYDLKIENNSADCVLLLEVIEHLENPQKAIETVHRVLKKNGLLILLFPNDFVFKLARLLTFRWEEAFYDSGHLKQWAPKPAIQTLERVGFRIQKIKNLPFVFWFCSFDCLVAARKK